MRISEQAEVANTIATEIYLQALNDYDAAATASLELLPLIGYSDKFTHAAKRYATHIGQRIESANWISPNAKYTAEQLHKWLLTELNDEA